jgi:hypothetical protein
MRINLYAGPGAGKSTTAAMLFGKLKVLGYSVELVSEYVKSWAIEKRQVIGFDQIYLMGKQLHYEHRFLSNGIQHIVTDSPVLLSACYTRAFYPNLRESATHMEGIVCEYEKQYPSVNVFLNRGNKAYKKEGRWQTKAEAEKLDSLIKLTLNHLDIPFTEFSFFDNDAILDHVLKSLQ